MPSNISTVPATEANVTNRADARAHADQPAPGPAVQSATSRYTNLLFPSRGIAGSDMPARRREAPAMEPKSGSWRSWRIKCPLLTIWYVCVGN